MAANDRQVGGAHYMGSPVQHWDLSALFQWDPMQYQIIKYTMRWRDKNGLLDLEKVVHFVEKYIEDVKAGRMPGPGQYPLRPLGREHWLAVLGVKPNVIDLKLDDEQMSGLKKYVDDAVQPVQNALALDAFRKYNAGIGFTDDGTRRLTLGEWIAKVGNMPDGYMIIPKEAIKPTGWAGFVFEGTKGGPDGEFDSYRCDRCNNHFKVLHLEPPITHACPLQVEGT